MRNKTTRVVGWIGTEAMTPKEASDAAIAKARELLGRDAGVLHLDTITGRLTLFADVKTPIPECTFVRGVRFDSCPDVLREDLESESTLLMSANPRRAQEVDERYELVRSMSAAHTTREIAAAAGRSESWVRLVLRQLKIKPCDPSEAARLEKARRVVAEMTAAGRSTNAIAQAAGISRATVWNWSKKA